MSGPGVASLRGVRVCMFVRNSFEFDARVEREALALAEAGARVTVVALASDRLGVPRREMRGPIEIRRVSRWFWLVDRLRSAWVRRAKPEGGGEPAGGAVTAGLNRMQKSWTVVRQVGPIGRIRDKAITIRMAAVGIARRADVFHAHELNTLEAAVLAARFGRGRLVYDSHEMAPEQENIAREPTEALERRLIRRADAVIHTTPMRAAWAAETYGIAMPAVVMNVPDAHDDIEPADLCAAFGFPAGSTVMLHPGGIQPKRGLEALVAAVSLLDDDYVLAFAGFGRLRPSLEELVDDLGLGNRVRFTPGPVPHTELLSMAAGAWCGFSLLVDTCLNHRYSLPNKLFESIAFGVPVVVSNNPEIAGFVAEHKAGEACDPQDPASIAGAVERLAGRYDEARAGAAEAGARYRWSHEKKSLLDVYEGLKITR